eukprot:2131644-Rhodomonas_salina.1
MPSNAQQKPFVPSSMLVGNVVLFLCGVDCVPEPRSAPASPRRCSCRRGPVSSASQSAATHIPACTTSIPDMASEQDQARVESGS